MILARPSYDLAFIDIRMPEMNGFQLYNEMKKIDRRQYSGDNIIIK
jgi:YesN/AraC family two-component response regulator